MHTRRRHWNADPYVAADGVVTQATWGEGVADDPSSLYQIDRDTSTTTPSLAGSSTQSEMEVSHFPIPQVQGVVPGRRRAWQLSASAASPQSHSHSLLHSQTKRDSVPMSQTLEASQAILTEPTGSSISSMVHSPSSLALTSSYPRISPPVFLHPSAIVPQHLSNSPSPLPSHRTAPASVGGASDTPATTTMTMTTYQPSVRGQLDYQVVYLSDGYKLLLIATLAMLTLMVMCACLVFCMNFPLKTWRMFGGDDDGDDEDDNSEGKRGRKKQRKQKRTEEKRPFDKPSKYASRHGSGEVQNPSLQRKMNSRREDAITSSGKYSAFSHLKKGSGDAHGEVGQGGIELRHRPSHRRYPHRWTGKEEAYTSRPRTPFPQGTQAQPSPSPHSSNSSMSSPLNPFLDVPPAPQRQSPATGHAEAQDTGTESRVQRSEKEYKKAHAAFFSTYPSTHSHSHSSPTSSPSPAYTLNVSSTQDLESGTVPTAARAGLAYHRDSSPEAREDGDGIAGMQSIVKKSVDWFDTRLEYVEGVVDGFVARVTRWTDDEDGKAALLPMVRGGGWRGEER